MTLALMGSAALNHYQFVRTPVDLDLLGTYESCVAYIKQLGKRERIVYNVPADGGKKIIVKTKDAEDKLRIYEFEIAWPDSNSEALLFMVMRESHADLHNGLIVPPLDVLYALKMSHRYKKDSPHFKKTMDDILLMRKLGAKIRPEHMEWFKWREKETYVNTLPKLNQSKKEFFTDTVPYTYDHDSVHLAVMFMDRPAYTFFKEDQSEVMVSKDMFYALPERIRLLSVVEESMVLAIERALVPHPNGMNPKQAFDYALSKCCTSIASGWWREFAWENYAKVQELYDPNYFERFKVALDNGVVKPHNNT